MNIEFVRNQADVERTGIDFVETELELARVFCRISKETNDPERRVRTLQHALRAYKAAFGVLKVFSMSRRGISADSTSVETLLNDVDRELARAR